MIPATPPRFRVRRAAAAASLLVALAIAAGRGEEARAAGLPLVFEQAMPADSPARPAGHLAPGGEAAFAAAGGAFLVDARGLVVAPAEPGAATLSCTLPGSDPSAVVAGEEPVPGGVSRFRGSDPSRWRTAIPSFHRLRVRDAYPGIDLVWHGSDSALEYDFVVAPGGDVSAIAVACGAEPATAPRDRSASRIDAQGGLEVHGAGRTLHWKTPVAWQQAGARRVEVDSRYVLRADGSFGFAVGAHDPALPLVIDPALSWSTYVAQASFTAGDGDQNHGLAIAADSSGNTWVAGVTESSGYPVTAGAYDGTRAGAGDVFVAKLAPGGDKLLWATYLGGSSAEIDDYRAAAITVDANGNAYVTGSTKSADFPTTPGALDTSLGGITDAFVTKIAASGASLAWSTLLGGSGLDRGWGLAVDAGGRVVVGGETSGGFPTTPGAYQAASTGASAFAAKLAADGASLLWSTTVGRSVGAAHDLAIDGQGNAYLTGSTTAGNGVSTGFPVTNGAYQSTFRGSTEAFVAKVKGDGSALLYSTLLGGAGNEDGRAIAVDGDGKAFVSGVTDSSDFPTTAGAYQSSRQSPGVADAFVARLDASGASLLAATYLGGDGLEEAGDLAVDGGGNALLAGTTDSTNFPVTADALQKTMDPGPVARSAFLAKVSSSGGLSYSTLDHPVVETAGARSLGRGIALDGNGAAYLAGTASDGLPTTSKAFQPSMYTFDTEGPFVTKFSGIATPTAKPTVCGDFTGDGKVTASDALGVLKTAVGAATCALKACDYNGDAKITAADALGVLKTAVGQTVTAKCPAS